MQEIKASMHRHVLGIGDPSTNNGTITTDTVSASNSTTDRSEAVTQGHRDTSQFNTPSDSWASRRSSPDAQAQGTAHATKEGAVPLVISEPAAAPGDVLQPAASRLGSLHGEMLPNAVDEREIRDLFPEEDDEDEDWDDLIRKVLGAEAVCGVPSLQSRMEEANGQALQPEGSYCSDHQTSDVSPDVQEVLD